MEVFSSLGSVRASGALRGGAVALGSFDGVHLGHRKLVERARALHDRHERKVGVLTFDPHPLHLLCPDRAPPLLGSLDMRLERLGAAGADVAVVVPFDAEYAHTDATEFVTRDLAGALGVRDVIVGFNFSAGRDRLGPSALRPLLGLCGINLHVVEPILHLGQVVSSSRVRLALQEGDLEAATAMLGRCHEAEGLLERRPTATLDPNTVAVVFRGGWLPGPGNYMVRVQARGETDRGYVRASTISTCTTCLVRREDPIAGRPSSVAEFVLPDGIHPVGGRATVRVAFLARMDGWGVEAGLTSPSSPDGGRLTGTVR